MFERFEDPIEDSNVYVHGSLLVVEQEGGSNFNMKKKKHTQVLLDRKIITIMCVCNETTPRNICNCIWDV